MKVEGKFWVEQNGKKVFGKGPYMLLEAVSRLGSLNKATDELNMSYSKAWSMIHSAEDILGYSLLETYTGGLDGGGSRLTPKAKALVKAYKGFCEEAELVLEELYNKHFKNV